jgi:hypothetical protein
LHRPQVDRYNPLKLLRLARSRWRRTLAATCVPYLFLSMFVGFVHLHRVTAGDVAMGAASRELITPPPRVSTLPDSLCAVCQWLRAGTGMQTSVVANVVTSVIAAEIAARPSVHPIRTILLSRDFRGPPLALFF